MAHAQKPEFVFRRNERVHLNWRGCEFIRLLATEVRASAVVMLDTPCSDIVWRVLATHSIRQFSLHFPSRASLCAITFQVDSTKLWPVLCTRVYFWICSMAWFKGNNSNRQKSLHIHSWTVLSFMTSHSHWTTSVTHKWDTSLFWKRVDCSVFSLCLF